MNTDHVSVRLAGFTIPLLNALDIDPTNVMRLTVEIDVVGEPVVIVHFRLNAKALDFLAGMVSS